MIKLNINFQKKNQVVRTGQENRLLLYMQESPYLRTR
jgi:hypothetical protein